MFGLNNLWLNWEGANQASLKFLGLLSLSTGGGDHPFQTPAEQDRGLHHAPHEAHPAPRTPESGFRSGRPISGAQSTFGVGVSVNAATRRKGCPGRENIPYARQEFSTLDSQQLREQVYSVLRSCTLLIVLVASGKFVD